MNDVKIYSVQDGIPTPDNPVEIVNIFEVNGIQYCDNIPSNRLIGITKEQYCEYKQLKQENQQLKSVIDEVREYIKKNVNRDVNYLNDDCIYSEWVIKEPEKLLEILNKVGDAK